MKTKLFGIAVSLLLAGNVMAQKVEDDRVQRAPISKEQMLKESTERMAKEYELTAEQAERLQAVNEKYADKLPMFRGPHNHRQGAPRRIDGNPQRREEIRGAEREQRQRPTEGQLQARRENMKETLEAYNAELKAIFTPEQYAKYLENLKKRELERQQRHRRN